MKKHQLSCAIGSLALCLAMPIKAALPDFTELVEKNSPAVVNISSLKSRRGGESAPSIPPQFRGMPDEWLRFFFGIPPQTPEPDTGPQLHSVGSGFILESNGYIVTNHHVIEGADEILVRFSDRREMSAKLIGSDERSDLALIKVDAENLPTARLGDSRKLKVGEWVVAIGSPFGFDYSVTAGIVSAKRRSLENDLYVPFIQSDVAVNFGNSGGPLFNLDGEVVGVNSQIYSRTGGFVGLSFSIPTDLVKNVVSQLKENGYVKRGYLGINIQEVTSDLSESFDLKRPHGALVSGVIPDSPASRMGAKIGDIVVEFDGKEIERSYDLPPMVGVTPVGKKAPVVVLRDGKRLTLYATIAQLPGDRSEKASGSRRSGDVIDKMGIQVSRLPEGIAERAVSGVYIRNIKRGSPAHRSGLRPGDVIQRLGNDKIETINQLREAVQELPRSTRTAILIWRNERHIFHTITID